MPTRSQQVLKLDLLRPFEILADITVVATMAHYERTPGDDDSYGRLMTLFSECATQPAWVHEDDQATRLLSLRSEHAESLNKLLDFFARAGHEIGEWCAPTLSPETVAGGDMPPEVRWIFTLFDLSRSGHQLFPAIPEQLRLDRNGYSDFFAKTLDRDGRQAVRYMTGVLSPAGEKSGDFYASIPDVVLASVKAIHVLSSIGAGDDEAIEKTEVAKKRRRPGRPQASVDEMETESAIAEKWRQAKEAGTSKPEFANGLGMTLKDFSRLLDRVRKRKQHSE